MPFLLPHLLEGIRNVKRADFLVILELEKLVASMACHVYEDIRSIVCQESL